MALLQGEPQNKSAGFPSLVVLGIIATLSIYFPFLASNAHISSDGQFAQFFDNGFHWSDRYIGGWPSYADPNSFAFYFLKYLFPANQKGFDYFTLSAIFIFAMGNSCLAWSLTRSRAASILAVMCAPGLGFLVAHLGHTSMLHAAAYVPWMLLAGLRLSTRSVAWPAWVALLAVATALSLATGHTQITVYGLSGCGLVAMPLTHRPSKIMSVYAQIVLGVTLGAALSAAFLVPALGFVADSLRASIDSETLRQFSLRPFELGINIFPYLAGGDMGSAAPTPYAGTDLTNNWSENIAYIGACIPFLILIGARELWFDLVGRKLILAFVLTSILALAPSLTNLSAWLVHVPALSLFRAWGRWQIVSSVIALQLACMAFARMTSASLPVKVRVRRAVTAILPLIATIALFRTCTSCSTSIDLIQLFTGPTLFQFLTLSLIAIVSVAWGIKGFGQTNFLLVAPILIAAIELLNLARHAPSTNILGNKHDDAHIEVLSQTKGLIATTKGRLLTLSGWTSPNLSPDIARAAGIPSLNWYGPLLSKRFAELVGMTLGGWTQPNVMSEQNQVLDLYGVSIVEPYVPNSAPEIPRGQELYPPARWAPVQTTNPAGLIFNTRSLPRIRLVGESILLSDPQILSALQTSRLQDGRAFRAARTALVENVNAVLSGNTVPVPRLKIADEQVERVAVTLESDNQARIMLVIGDNYSPNWTAWVDGRPAAVARVNYNQIGVIVPAHTRSITAEYQDPLLRLGIVISAFAALLTTLTGLYGARVYSAKNRGHE
ncbi:YfhO family protein [Dyella soli]|uniref:YfhO family protein n=1 Tax=Dyella soli TaxID=522319 RepID=A0A4R0YXJ2_9GAMM|nr:YfhO family protein [Dyella soli]TCI11120.1 hypothetical protein EZM97_20120 [Dyella soli]